MNKLPDFPSFSNVKKLSVQTSPNKLLPVIFFTQSPSPNPTPSPTPSSPSQSKLDDDFDQFWKDIHK